jgi:hypothetical protein
MKTMVAHSFFMQGGHRCKLHWIRGALAGDLQSSWLDPIAGSGGALSFVPSQGPVAV